MTQLSNRVFFARPSVAFTVAISAALALMVATLGCGSATEEPKMAQAGMAGTGTKAPAAAVDPTQKIVTVADVVLTRADLDRAIGSMLQSVGVPPDRVDAQMRKLVEARAMDSLIRRELLKQEAKRRGFSITDKEVAGAMQKFRAGLPPQIPYATWLERMGLTDQAFRDEMRANFMVGKLQEETLAAINKPSDTELKALFEKRKDDLVRVEEGSGHQILVAVAPDAVFEMVEEARKKAKAIAGDLKGKSLKAFKKAAKNKSDDAKTKDKGGNLGQFGARTVLPDFWMAFKNLKKGEVSDPVRTDRGFVIIRSGGKKRGKDRTFDELKPQLLAMEANRSKGEAIKTLVDGLMSSAKITRHYEPPPPPPRGAPGQLSGKLPPLPEAPPGSGVNLPGTPMGMPGGGTPLPPGAAHGMPEMPANGKMPLPSADNVLPGVRNPHAAGGGHGGAASQPAGSDLNLNPEAKKPTDDLKLNP